MKSNEIIRFFLVVFILFHYFNPHFMDSVTSMIYENMLASAFFRHDSAEPIIAVVSFIIWILCWYVYDVFSNSTKVKLWREPKRQDRNGFFSVLFTYLLPILVFDQLFPRRHKLLTEIPPSFFRLISEIWLGLFIYDTGFYICHRLIHHPSFYKQIHSIHHKYLPTTARETFRLSLSEVWIDSGISIIALNLIKAHPMSRSIYNIYITYLLVELHSDHEFDWMTHKVIGMNLMGGPKYHSKHHQRIHGNYGKFFTIWDRILGTSLKN